MRGLEYQAKKEARPETNLSSVVSEEYNNFLDKFFKKHSDILLSHQKYDHKMILKEH